MAMLVHQRVPLLLQSLQLWRRFLRSQLRGASGAVDAKLPQTQCRLGRAGEAQDAQDAVPSGND